MVCPEFGRPIGDDPGIFSSPFSVAATQFGEVAVADLSKQVVLCSKDGELKDKIFLESCRFLCFVST